MTTSFAITGLRTDAPKILRFDLRRFLYPLPESEVYPLRKAGAEAVKWIASSPKLQKLSRKRFGVLAKNKSL